MDWTGGLDWWTPEYKNFPHKKKTITGARRGESCACHLGTFSMASAGDSSSSNPIYISESPRSFALAFITGNISICAGCSNHYPKPAAPPYDICVRHTEWRTFYLVEHPNLSLLLLTTM